MAKKQESESLVGDYRKFRWFYTSSGKLVVGGKSAEQNDFLLMTLKETEKEMIVMHTSEPGSPFSVVLADINNINESDLIECATFTGCFSRAWKLRKSKTMVDMFKLSQIYKSKEMKEGTWGVNGKIDRISVKIELGLTRQKEILRAVPLQSIKPKALLIKVLPGNIEKSDISAKLELELDDVFDQEELLSALPAGGVSLKR